MDPGPNYNQTNMKELQLCKNEIYKALATTGTEWLINNLTNLPEPKPQDDSEATFTVKFDKSLSLLKPEVYTADELHRQVVAFLGYPKSKYEFYNKECIVLESEVSETETPISLKCKDGKYLSIKRLQPAGKKPMDAKSFLNGYAK